MQSIRGGLFLIITAFGGLGKLMQHHYFGVQKNAYTTNHLIGVVKVPDIYIIIQDRHHNSSASSFRILHHHLLCSGVHQKLFAIIVCVNIHWLSDNQLLVLCSCSKQDAHITCASKTRPPTTYRPCRIQSPSRRSLDYAILNYCSSFFSDIQ
jgi:hypothetical protein